MTNYNERLDEILDGRVCPTCFIVVEIIDESIIFDETIKSETLKQTLKCENKSCPTLYRAKRFGNDWYIDKSISKQALTSLTKELVAEVLDRLEAEAVNNANFVKVIGVRHIEAERDKLEAEL